MTQRPHARPKHTLGALWLAPLALAIGCQSPQEPTTQPAASQPADASASNTGPTVNTASPAAPRQVPSWEALQDRAVDQAIRSAQSSDPRERANALEALTPVPEVVSPLLPVGAQDARPVVRFAALVTAGRVRDHNLGPTAERLAVSDPDPSVRAAAIYAARRVGLPASLAPIPELLADPRPGVRSNVASIVGLLGKKSAVPMLDTMRRKPLQGADALQQTLTDVQFAAAIYRLSNSPAALEFIRGVVYLRDNDPARVLAIQTLGRLGDRDFRANLNNLMNPVDEPIQVRLAAAEALARLGSPQPGLHVVIEAAQYDAQRVRNDLKRYFDSPLPNTAIDAPQPAPGEPQTDADRAAFERLRVDQNRLRDQEAQRRQNDRALLSDTSAHERIAAGVRAQAGSVLGLFDHELTREVSDRLLEDLDPRVRLSASAGVLLYDPDQTPAVY
ncbi:MAG: HEAT repeat domain-containing protein [Planctomycetota bacterium]